MATPEEIAEILKQNSYKPPRGPLPQSVRILVFVVLIIGIGTGGWFLVKRYVHFEGFSVRGLVQNVTSSNPLAVAKKVTFEKKGTYELYRPETFATAKTKRLVLVLSPGGEIAEMWQYMNYWVKTADTHGLLIAGIPNWSGDKIVRFLQTVREAEGVERVYTSGFSNGGYNSCYAGLVYPHLVDGVVPMGAFCFSKDAFTQAAYKKPIYAVIGSKDNWALGDDGHLAYDASKGLAIEFLIVPGLGHSFPEGEMQKVGVWISAH